MTVKLKINIRDLPKLVEAMKGSLDDIEIDMREDENAFAPLHHRQEDLEQEALKQTQPHYEMSIKDDVEAPGFTVSDGGPAFANPQTTTTLELRPMKVAQKPSVSAQHAEGFASLLGGV